jgi:hydrogenase maturation protein HypF
VRLHLSIEGAVQGVGFRPAVYRLATELGLAGWVSNGRSGVQIEVEGPHADIEAFAARLAAAPPPLALVRSTTRRWVDVEASADFVIRSSDESGATRALLLPDVAICPECLAEIHAPDDRRAGYPFTNCTNCGPRFSIIEALPYDRPRTTMRGFPLCPTCLAEYENPTDRRFHAQPTACPVCGPTVTLVARDDKGAWQICAHEGEALTQAAHALCEGRIVAVKGLGGFHLMADAANEGAVAQLRARKAREEKPFAVMVRTLDDARALVEVDAAIAALLTSSAAPIVLAPRRAGAPIAQGVAPGNPTLGVMLAYTPLHHLLLEQTGRALVATSGNRSDEPICIDNDEALERLGALGDLFLLHNRPIARHVDDSVATMLDGAPRILRRARGYAPLPIALRTEGPTLLAVGGHLKNAVALAVGREVFVSQHIGDLESPEAHAAFARVIADFVRMYDAQPVAIAHDLHPDYASTQWARQAAAEGTGSGPGALAAGLPLIGVQHHHAHMAACLAENDANGPALGVIWDGSGYGPENTTGGGSVWGGEFLLGDMRAFTRAAHLRTFRLPGGEAAVREPRRSALGLLWELDGDTDATGALRLAKAFAPGERDLLGQMLARHINAPLTSSAGRLFDAIAALLGICVRSSFEGQAAMALEHIADPSELGVYTLRQCVPLDPAAPLLLDWEPLVRALLDDQARGVSLPLISARVHRGLAHAIADVAAHMGMAQVALSGGCFQNRLLLNWTAEALRSRGLQPLLHSQTPPSDGCIALGQIAVARKQIQYS